MMKKTVEIFIFLFFCHITIYCQNRYTDSLRQQLAMARNDTSVVLVLSDLCYFYRYTNNDSSAFFGERALELAKKIKFLRGEANALITLGLSKREKGDLSKALELELKALRIAEENNFLLEKSGSIKRISLVYMDLKDYRKTIEYSTQSLKIDSAVFNNRGIALNYMNLGMTYKYMNNPDSAMLYSEKAFQHLKYIEDLTAEVYRVRAEIESMKGNKSSALLYFRRGIQYGLQFNDYRTISFIYANMADMYNRLNQPDSSIFYAIKGVEYGQKTSYKKGILLSANLLSQLYDSINPKEALRYYKIAAAAKDSLFGVDNIQTIQNLISKEAARQREIDDAIMEFQNKLKQYSLLAGFAVIGIIAFILFKNNRQKNKANLVLQQQKEKVESTLSALKSTQSQLIQSEKMASLGELTAGIAHEIQNPLNFVNNFSEVSNELIDEMNTELDKGDIEEAKAIAQDVKQNLEKINHHGQRAADIVKGMLQHSRSSTGQNEPTDINALADEYLRLAYHGQRGKDKLFNVTMKTDFDESIGNINIIPQDIGRVILNLINNAFYAVNERYKAESIKPNAEGTKYDPTVSVSTKKEGDKILIAVKDNGNGIPQKIADKLFQPFFTTKPTGQGTGLGLSLSYDIVKAHGGEIKVVTKVDEGNSDTFGKGSEFIIILPIV